MSDRNPTTRTEQRSGGGARVWWRVLGSVLAVGVLGWSLFVVVSLLAQHNVDIDRTVPAAGVATIEVRLSSGSLEVAGSDTSSISLSGTLTEGLVKGDHSEALYGDTFLVKSTCPLVGANSCSADYRIEVPRSLHVKVVSDNTSVTMRGLDGRVEVLTSNSPVRVDTLAGDTDLRTSNDSIDAVGLAGNSTTLVTSNGRVRAEFARSPRSVKIRTSNDSVSLLLPDTPATFATRVGTSNGDRSVEIRTDPGSERVIDVETSNDDVTVAYSQD